MLCGDFNVRLRSDDDDGVHIGRHIFEKHARDGLDELPGIIENRELFTKELMEHDLIATNTFFHTIPSKLITYKENKQHEGGPPFDRKNYDTLDYILIQQRWRNAVTNVESYMDSGINSDHYPLLSK